MSKRILGLAILTLILFSIYFSDAFLKQSSIPINHGKINSASDSTQYVLWQTNFEEDNIHIIDIEKQELIQLLKVGKNPHGVAFSKETNRVYVSVEDLDSERGELLWIHADTYEIEKRVFICEGPHEIEVTPDGAFIYVPCKDNRYRVYDGNTGELITEIETGGRPHNTRISGDGETMYLSPLGSPRTVTVVDVTNEHEVVGEIKFSNSVRPSALTSDGKYFFQQVDGLNGFEVADLITEKRIARIEHTEKLGILKFKNKDGWWTRQGFKKCHGLEIRPDQEEIWSVCGDLLRIHNTTNPDFEEIFSFKLEAFAYWLTFSPDSKYASIALQKANQVLVMDARNKTELFRFDVGKSPKRNLIIKKDLPGFQNREGLKRSKEIISN